MFARATLTVALALAGCASTPEPTEPRAPAAPSPPVARAEPRTIPHDAGLCPLNAPKENVRIERDDDEIVVTVTTSEPTVADDLPARARDIGDHGYYAPASAYEDPEERGLDKLKLYSGVAVEVDIEPLIDGVEITFEPRDPNDLDKLEAQLESDKRLLRSDRCESRPPGAEVNEPST